MQAATMPARFPSVGFASWKVSIITLSAIGSVPCLLRGALTGPILTTWHNHYHWDIPSAGLQREQPERLLCNVYVDGTSTKWVPW